MRSLVSAISVLAFSCCLEGQVAITLNELPNGSTEVRVQNNSALSLTAFAISATLVSPHGGSANGDAVPYMAYYDSAVDQAMKPLPAHQERVLPLPSVSCAPMGNIASTLLYRNGDPSKREFPCKLQQPVVAGILDNGSTTGDAALLTRLMLRRSNMLLAVETTLDILSGAGRGNVPREQLIGQFRKWADSVHHWYLLPEQAVGYSLYESIIFDLTNLPEQKFGQPFPPDDFVEQETGVLRRQRLTLLASRPGLADVASIGR